MINIDYLLLEPTELPNWIKISSYEVIIHFFFFGWMGEGFNDAFNKLESEWARIEMGMNENALKWEWRMEIRINCLFEL